MKNRKKQLINEKPSLVKTKLKKAFTLISADNGNSGLIKRICCGCLAFALICCSFAFIGNNNKAFALSKPTDKEGNIYSSYLANSFMYFTGVGSADSLINPTGFMSKKSVLEQNSSVSKEFYLGYMRGLRTEQDYNKFVGTSVDSFISQYAKQNTYYDSSSGIDYAITQNFGNPFDYFVSCYRTSNIYIQNEKSSMIYIPSAEYFADLKLWFTTYNESIYNVLDSLPDLPDKYKRQLQPEAIFLPESDMLLDKLNHDIIPTRAKLTLSYTTRDASGGKHNWSFTDYTYDNGVSGGAYYTHDYATFTDNVNIFTAIEDSLKGSINKNNCYLIEDLTVECEIQQMVFEYVGSVNPYNDNFDKYLDYVQSDENTYETGWTFEPVTAGDNSCYGTMYFKVPLYEENYLTIQQYLSNATELYLDPTWNDSQTIYGFWSRFLDIEILPNFKLTYLLMICFAFTLLTIFVRFFR